MREIDGVGERESERERERVCVCVNKGEKEKNRRKSRVAERRQGRREQKGCHCFKTCTWHLAPGIWDLGVWESR